MHRVDGQRLPEAVEVGGGQDDAGDVVGSELDGDGFAMVNNTNIYHPGWFWSGVVGALLLVAGLGDGAGDGGAEGREVALLDHGVHGLLEALGRGADVLPAGDRKRIGWFHARNG